MAMFSWPIVNKIFILPNLRIILVCWNYQSRLGWPRSGLGCAWSAQAGCFALGWVFEPPALFIQSDSFLCFLRCLGCFPNHQFTGWVVWFGCEFLLPFGWSWEHHFCFLVSFGQALSFPLWWVSCYVLSYTKGHPVTSWLKGISLASFWRIV